jgi:hypothetical protein
MVIVQDIFSNGVPFAVTAADLIEEALSSPPGSVILGASFTVSDTTDNQGNATAAASVTQYYLSPIAEQTKRATLLSGSRAVAALAPGMSSGGSVRVSVPSMTPGAYFLQACANDTRTAVESTYANNCRSATTRIVVSAPDLVESAVSNPPPAAIIGARFYVTDSAHNQGNAAAGSSMTRYYLAPLGTIAPGTPFLLDGSRSVPGLAAEASSTGTTVVSIPSMVPGGYLLLAWQTTNALRSRVISRMTARPLLQQ